MSVKTDHPVEGLLPCPFCGGTPEMYEELDDLGDFRVQCDCGATCGGLVYSEKEAVEYWNRRVRLVVSPSLVSDVEAVVKTKIFDMQKQINYSEYELPEKFYVKFKAKWVELKDAVDHLLRLFVVVADRETMDDLLKVVGEK